MSNNAYSFDASLRFDYAQVGDVRLHYAEHGTGERLIVLLHGFPECWYSWRHQLSAFGEDFKVVAPDLRGYNLSDKPPSVDDYKLDKLVDDVTGLIRHFGKDKAIIVGHDWGAVIAWTLAAKYPGYVEKLIALQVPPLSVWRKNQSFAQGLSSWYMLFFQLPRVPEWWLSRNDFAQLKKSLKMTAWRRTAFDEHDLQVYADAFKREGALTAAINYYRANLKNLFKPLSENRNDARIRVPTLFIYGERDFAVLPATVKGVGSVIDAEYREVRIATAGHWVQQEAAREVNDELRDFINQNFER